MISFAMDAPFPLFYEVCVLHLLNHSGLKGLKLKFSDDPKILYVT